MVAWKSRLGVSAGTRIERGAGSGGREATGGWTQPALTAWAAGMGFLSGFLGGLCGIRGPPIIVFFLHCSFRKEVQRANATVVTFFNVLLRALFYIIDSSVDLDIPGRDKEQVGQRYFKREDWYIFVVTVVFGGLGAPVGVQIFKRIKDTQATIKTILSFFLVLCGFSLLLASFT